MRVDKCITPYNHPQNITPDFHVLKNSLHSLSYNPSNCLHSFAFFITSCSDTHTGYDLLRLASYAQLQAFFVSDNSFLFIAKYFTLWEISVWQFIYSSTSWRMFWLLPGFDNYEDLCAKQSCESSCVAVFSSSEWMQMKVIAGLYGKRLFCFVR